MGLGPWLVLPVDRWLGLRDKRKAPGEPDPRPDPSGRVRSGRLVRPARIRVQRALTPPSRFAGRPDRQFQDRRASRSGAVVRLLNAGGIIGLSIAEASFLAKCNIA